MVPAERRDIRMMRRWAIALVVVFFAIRPCASAEEFAADVDGGAISWWRFDPSAFASTEETPPERRIFIATVRAAIASGLFGDGTSAKIIEGILAASDVGAVEHTLSLLSFSAERPPSGTGVEMHRLQMVLELHTGENHERYLRTIKAIVVDAERAKRGDRELGAGRQRVLELPDGSRGVAFRFPGWPAWREVSWSSRDDAFVIAIGRGALEARFGRKDVGGSSPWRDHQSAVEAQRDDGRTFFSAFLDIDHLRGAFPEAFVDGRTPRMVRALGLGGASELMLHGRLVASAGENPPMLALDATTREEPGGEIARVRASIGAWDDRRIPLPPPSGSYILAAPIEWPSFAERLLDVYSATVRDDEIDAFRGSLALWLDTHGEAFERVLGALEPWLVISDDPTPVLPVPGLSTYIVPIREGADRAQLREDMSRMLSSWGDVVTRSEGGVWTLSLHESGLVRFPSWSIVETAGGAALVAGWSPRVIEHTRRALRETPSRGTSRTSGQSPRR